jgi:hypothetical protein
MDPEKIPAFTIAAGGVEVTVRFLDESKAPETVKVPLLKMSAYQAFFEKLEDETALCDFLCDKPAGWGATLQPESVMDVVEKGTDLNFTPARRWAERRANLNQQCMPIARRMNLDPKGFRASASSAPTSPV